MNTTKIKCDELKNYYGAMSFGSDIFIASELLKMHCPACIAEFGAGSGGWSMTINEVLSYNNISPHFYLIENFNWPNKGIIIEGWPTNNDELSSHISSMSPKMKFDIVNHNNTIENVDTFRIDATASYNLMDEYINVCTDDAIIFIDDFNPNSGIYRIMYAIKAAAEKKIFPVWLGEKESMWCKNKEKSEMMVSHMYNIRLELKSRGVELFHTNYGDLYGGIEWNFIRTKENNFIGMKMK